MIVLVGGSGYVGTAYQSYFNSHGIPFVSVNRSTLNLCDKDAVSKFFKELKPQFLVNAAGYTGKPNVDMAEKEKTRCLLANTILPGVLYEVCTDQKIPWGHISSGCIFSGSRPDGSGFTEEDTPNFSFRQNNCSFYSGTKALAEEIMEGSTDCYTWRLRIPFNEVDGPRNYLSKVINYAKLIDVRNSISQLDEFVRATWLCWEKRVPFGVYNIVNPGSITTREVVEKIKQRRMVNKEFQFFKDEAEFMQVAAKVPRANCVMDCSKLLKTGIPMMEIHEAVDWALDHWKKVN
ncbi:MAG: dTDP-4-dehydrorhamnose reductase [Verrucomicrobia bacterium Tous-C9LFEB]|nr:MAG: dTDP-4-dehydrorhamnose reductase [Verrucomicrobia bacterium Tous-C9LFEB]